MLEMLAQPGFWVLKLEPKPHHRKVIQKTLSWVRATGHKQQVATLPPQHTSFGSQQAQALHPASVQGRKFSWGATTNKQLPLPKPAGSFKRLLLNLYFYSASLLTGHGFTAARSVFSSLWQLMNSVLFSKEVSKSVLVKNSPRGCWSNLNCPKMLMPTGHCNSVLQIFYILSGHRNLLTHDKH